MISQWTWNLRLELGHQLKPPVPRTTACAPAIPEHREPGASPSSTSPPPAGYGPPATATCWKAGRFTGSDFPLQPDGTLRCPAGQKLVAQEQRREAGGRLRVVESASIHRGRPCPLREQCQWNGSAPAKPRQVRVLLHPLRVGPAPLLWQDGKRREPRRAWIQLVRHHRLEVSLSSPAASPPTADAILSRAQRAHSRLSWARRLARNARPETSGQVAITLLGIPATFAASLGFAAVSRPVSPLRSEE